MDILSATASIIAILQLSTKILTHLNDVRIASKDRARCAVEISNLYSLLVSLRFRLEEGGASQPWYIAVRALTVKNGPLDQFKQALKLLQAKMMTDGGWLKQASETLMWKFNEDEVASILAGKTMIAAITINSLLRSAQNISSGIAIVYCNYKTREKQDASSMLAAILKQLVQGRLQAIEPVERLHKRHYCSTMMCNITIATYQCLLRNPHLPKIFSTHAVTLSSPDLPTTA
jgi:hypothetical protein